MTRLDPRGASPDAPVPAARLHIDWTRCDGRGLCTELLPELLDRDEWGYPIARSLSDRSDVPVPPELEQAALDAVTLCPVIALRLTRR
ncbi:ferredoxin [Gryllotalpicola ginsengisoli]|uniref:ferredoxin n=1 Tax=Gryllotalpicola ginsengisoli TaxID=444608 RepID=UPI0003B4F66E|nr:ferredoxin [Gryllotalpicola ginsengisoli]